MGQSRIDNAETETLKTQSTQDIGWRRTKQQKTIKKTHTHRTGKER